MLIVKLQNDLFAGKRNGHEGVDEMNVAPLDAGLPDGTIAATGIDIL